MTEDAAKQQLLDEGFLRVYAWQDGPGAFYDDHTHPFLSAHIILDGEMTLVVDAKTHPLRIGDRFDVPANTVHNATMGEAGCRYMIGEK